jgi:hypothetical protein
MIDSSPERLSTHRKNPAMNAAIPHMGFPLIATQHPEMAATITILAENCNAVGHFFGYLPHN